MANDTAESSSNSQNSVLSEQFNDVSMAVAFGFVRSFVRCFFGWLVGLLIRSFARSLIHYLIICTQDDIIGDGCCYCVGSVKPVLSDRSNKIVEKWFVNTGGHLMQVI